MASLFLNPPLAMLTIVLVVKVYYLVFALLSIVGGVMGYVKAKSIVSVISGCVSGALLVAASFMVPGRHPNVAYIIALLVSVLLAGKFLPDFVRKKAAVPGGLMTVLSLGGIVLTLLAWYGK
jgi:uncharacterized membrane protein (UPF0136 family)